ncbi:hypothetical protein [Streptomyces sp. NBC_01465]|uniref:hypothetical protein n=1 Tax=Streptomyces sp. NBC_01465 TaxID=2903878 RepID=UPI002E2F7900|nr:hypothetical protein [Streptomyces sp. NBC_01465]
MSGDPYDGHHPVLVILVAVAGCVAALWIDIRAVLLLSRAGAGWTTRTAVKGAALLVWAGMIGMYTWGVLHLVLLDEDRQLRACQEALGPERAKLLDGYETSFVPLRFGCHLENGWTYEAVVPGYVNPVTGIFAVTAGVLTLVVRYSSEGVVRGGVANSPSASSS